MGLFKAGGVIFISWAASLAAIHKLCGTMFGCGCTWIWEGGSEHCNIHHPFPPHCPWCTHGLTGFLWVPALLLLAEAVVVMRLRKRSIIVLLVAAAATYLAVGAAAGLVSALMEGYPRWFGWKLP
jgi:hypothetical protein